MIVKITISLLSFKLNRISVSKYLFMIEVTVFSLLDFLLEKTES